MGLRGPARKPTALRVLEGNRSRRPLNSNEPKPKSGKVTCPRFLSPSAKDEWRRISPELTRLGLLTQVDRSALAIYASAWGDYVTACRHIEDEGFINKEKRINRWYTVKQKSCETLLKFGREFGLSPSGRSNLDIKPIEEKLDPLELIIGDSG